MWKKWHCWGSAASFVYQKATVCERELLGQRGRDIDEWEKIIYIMGKYSLQGTTQGRYLTGGVSPMIAGQIGKFLPMDEETAEQFRQLAKRMMEQVGK